MVFVVLRCECGGAVRVQNGTDPENSGDGFFETYECESCGRTGTLTYDRHTGTSITGCLIRGSEEYPL
ncbi:MAG: hypothetical protein ACI8VE_002813 [Natrialbaceae archaeon]